jgi:hypothetical protein
MLKMLCPEARAVQKTAGSATLVVKNINKGMKFITWTLDRSLVRSSLGCQTMGWEYDQMGLVATLHLAPSAGHNTTAFQRFLPGGPVGTLPWLDCFSFNLNFVKF